MAYPIPQEDVEAYIAAIQSAGRDITMRIAYSVGTGGVLDDEQIVSATFTSASQANNGVSIGGTFSTSFTVTLRGTDLTPGDKGTFLIPDIGVNVSETGENYKWVPMGQFRISNVEKLPSGAVTTLRVTANDRMADMDDSYDMTHTGARVLLTDIIGRIRDNKDISVSNHLLNMAGSLDVANTDFTRYTNRQILGYIAGYLGGNMWFNRAGELDIKMVDFVWVRTIPPSLQYLNGLRLAAEQYSVWGSLTSGTKENIIVAGDGAGISFENPFMTQERLNTLYNTYFRLPQNWWPLSCKWRGDPAVDIGDVVRCTTDTAPYSTIITQQTIAYGGGMNSTIVSGDAQEIGYVFSSSHSPIDRKLDRQYAAYENMMKDAADTISGETGGNVWLERNENGRPIAIYVMDTTDKSTAESVWRFNKSGLGHSKGIDGSYNVALTSDGKIGADALYGATIEGGTIIGVHGSFTDLTAGEQTGARLEMGNADSDPYIDFYDGVADEPQLHVYKSGMDMYGGVSVAKYEVGSGTSRKIGLGFFV